jgi:hypothetical protein
MNELVQIINDAKDFYVQNEQSIKISAVAAVLMAAPAYYTAKKAVVGTKKLLKRLSGWIDEQDAKIPEEHKEFYRKMNQYGSGPFNDRFGPII